MPFLQLADGGGVAFWKDTSELVSGGKPKAVPAALNRKLTAWLESRSLSAPKLKSADG